LKESLQDSLTINDLKINLRFLYSTWPYIVLLACKLQMSGKTCCMNLENTQIQMRKGILEFCILHIISRGEVYASTMLNELTAAKMIVVEGTLYPLLTRLKNAGLLEYKWVESKEGPPRKYYKLTDEGAQFLKGLSDTWSDLVNSTETVRSKQEATN
jgi:PadR family transcriptional regulator, regulatory protein PadR